MSMLPRVRVVGCARNVLAFFIELQVCLERTQKLLDELRRWCNQRHTASRD
jgi:hypothetical protein